VQDSVDSRTMDLRDDDEERRCSRRPESTEGIGRVGKSTVRCGWLAARRVSGAVSAPASEQRSARVASPALSWQSQRLELPSGKLGAGISREEQRSLCTDAQKSSACMQRMQLDQSNIGVQRCCAAMHY
jgi:hypothetical protein